MHLWSLKHEDLQAAKTDPFQEHLTKQGYEVEALAQEFLRSKYQTDSTQLFWQRTFTADHFQCRTDALVYDTVDDCYDLYEIKSSTNPRDTTHLYDAAYQTLILKEELNLRHIYIVTVNSEYVRDGAIDVDSFFTINLVDMSVKGLLEEVSAKREEAWLVCMRDECSSLEACLEPKSCPCPDHCHPNLPDLSIFSISGLASSQKKELRSMGITAMLDIPDDYSLKPKQRAQIDVTRSGVPLIDRDLIRHELEQITTPIAFMDYETFNPGIPQFDGYRPYGTMVFQYSLHVVEHLDQPIKHYEHLVTTQVDPGREIVQALEQDMPKTGTVIAWNKTFEQGCNRSMSELYPGYRDFLLDVNDRMYDLGDPFKNNNMYVLPEFKGSWSIKNVLPVLCPDLSYKTLDIGEGATAMNAWWKMVFGDCNPEEKEKIRADLLTYCGLDTLAMVRIWEKLIEVISEP